MTHPLSMYMENCMRQFIFSALMFTGCATADQVKELNTKVEEMEKKIAELEKAPKAAATAKTAQQHVTPQPSSMDATTNGTGSVVREHTKQKVAARMARIDKLAQQKEAKYEWTQVAHQSGKSYWYALFTTL